MFFFQEFFIEANTIPTYDLEVIKIDACKDVRFGNNAISNMRNLRTVELSNIQNLQFEESSLVWDNYNSQFDYTSQWDINIPSLRILIENSHIEKISSYTFKGRINEITMINVIIASIAPFSFSSLLQTYIIKFENATLRNVQPQAFKKFTTNNLHLQEISVDFLPSRAFADIQVNENFVIQNSYLDTLRPSAFLITSPRNFEVRDTRFNQLDGEGFRVTTRGSVMFKNNVFNVTNDGAFRGIRLTPEERQNEYHITFDSNTFNTVSRDSLLTTDFIPKFINIVLNEPCDCKTMNHILKTSEFFDEVYCISSRGESTTFREYQKYNCSIMASHATLIIVIGVVLIIFILIVSALVFYFKKVRNSDKYGNNKNSKNGKLSLIVPDGRTYRETEVHVIVERANLLTTDL